MPGSIEPFTLSIETAKVERVITLAKQSLDLLEDDAQLNQKAGPDQDGGDVDPYGYGLPLEQLRELANRLIRGYNWRKEESAINDMGEHGLFTVDIAGQGPMQMHFVHRRSTHPKAIPLVLTHGWPGSFFEFHAIAPMLTAPRDGQQAFHVVMPSIFGYTFSSKPREDYVRMNSIAHAINQLMQKLGYNKYVAQGGDWGSLVTRSLAQLYPQKCVAIHLNFMQTPTPPSDMESQTDLSEMDQRGLKRGQHFRQYAAAYANMQGTVPYTLGAALSLNPVALLAYIGEKMYRWSAPDSHPKLDEIITNVLLYWFSRSITSSFWLYYNRLHDGDVKDRTSSKTDVPTAFACGPHELHWPPESVVQSLHPNLLSYEVLPHGGHFLALERPATLADSIRAHFSKEEVHEALQRPSMAAH